MEQEPYEWKEHLARLCPKYGKLEHTQPYPLLGIRSTTARILKMILIKKS